MNAPLGADQKQREVLELYDRFSALSGEISVCLDAVLIEIQHAPGSGNQTAFRIARDLVTAQYAVTQQLALLSGLADRNAAFALPGPKASGAHAQPLLAAPLPVPGPRAPATQDYDYDYSQLLSPPLQPPPVALLPYREDARWPRPHGQGQTWLEHAPGLSVSEELPRAEPGRFLAQEAEPAPQVPPAARRAGRDLPRWARGRSRASRHAPMMAAAVFLTMVLALALILNAAGRQGENAAAPPEPGKPAGRLVTTAGEDRAHAASEVVTAPAPAQAPVTFSSIAAPDPATTAPMEPQAQTEPAPDLETNEVPERPAFLTADDEAQSEPSAQVSLADEATHKQSVRKPAPVIVNPPPAAAAEANGVAEQAFAAGDASVGERAPPKLPAKVPPPKQARTEAQIEAQGGAQPGAQVKTGAKTGSKTERTPAAVAPFKTAVIKPAEPKAFVPELLQLKDGTALLGIFKDLQQRHPAALAGRRAELRPAAGPSNAAWMSLLAVPPMTRDEAEGVCRDMGAEGTALGCKVTSY